jgi:hypothetical protein
VRPFLVNGRRSAPLLRRHPARASGRAGPTRARGALQYVAAAAIVVGGYVHFCLYRHGFRAIPTVGTGFLLQALTSVAIASALIARDRIVHVGRIVVRSALAVRLVGIAISLGTLAAFGLSQTPMGIFNFRERGLEPAPQALIALVAELAAVVLLTTTFLLDRRGAPAGVGSTVRTCGSTTWSSRSPGAR